MEKKNTHLNIYLGSLREPVVGAEWLHQAGILMAGQDLCIAL